MMPDIYSEISDSKMLVAAEKYFEENAEEYVDENPELLKEVIIAIFTDGWKDCRQKFFENCAH